LAAASTGEKEGEIPAPPADESADIDYDALYPLVFTKPTSYIRFSQTVEESTGCQYDMTTEDDVFLKEYNKKKSGAKCSEDVFEKIMAVFEETATIHTPYASVDNTVVPFETMKTVLAQQLDDKLQSFAKDFYDHWIARQQLQPTLKYETHQDNDDGDPYVCFRYREVRQTRKTRARDNVSADRLKKLRREMEEAKSLVMASHQRELMKRDLIKCDRQIFKQRSTLKDTKVKLGIKANDDDLINQKVGQLSSISCSSLTINSLRRNLDPLISQYNDHQYKDGCQVELMAVLSMLILFIYPTSKRRRRMTSGVRLTRRLLCIANGMMNMLT